MKSSAFCDGPEHGVLRHPVRLAQRNRRHRMAIQPHTPIRRVLQRHEQIAVLLLMPHQIPQPTRNHILVSQFAMVIARPLKRHQRQRRRRRIAHELAPSGKPLQAPASVCPLMPSQKHQSPLDRLLAFGRISIRSWPIAAPQPRARPLNASRGTTAAATCGNSTGRDGRTSVARFAWPNFHSLIRTRTLRSRRHINRRRRHHRVAAALPP